ncbi:MAG: hypothetical protein M3Y49_10735 [Actinomycetota bacterium]|nr:hypothetical protein [Actinomycetota bacterium]
MIWAHLARAQLVDVYLHNPAAAATSTTSSYPGMNYSIAPPAAWSPNTATAPHPVTQDRGFPEASEIRVRN